MCSGLLPSVLASALSPQNDNTAWKKMRLAAVPPGAENGPPWRDVDLPNSWEPTVPMGVL